MDVRSFKLSTGEELVAELKHATGTGYMISKPLVVHVMRGQDGHGQLAFAQWSMVQDEDDIEILDHALVARPVKLLDAVAKSYVEQTTTVFLTENAKSQILMS